MLPDLGLFSTVFPAYLTNGSAVKLLRSSVRFVGFPSFPAFLGKYSSQSRWEDELQVIIYSCTAQAGRWPKPLGASADEDEHMVGCLCGFLHGSGDLYGESSVPQEQLRLGPRAP